MSALKSGAEADKALSTSLKPEFLRVHSNPFRDPSDHLRSGSPSHGRHVAFASLPGDEEQPTEGAGFDQWPAPHPTAVYSTGYTHSPTENSPIRLGFSVPGHCPRSSPPSGANLVELPLKDQLNRSFIRSAYDDTKSFLPRTALFDHIQPESIKRYWLALSNADLHEECSNVIQYVCGASRHARHVFAILVLIEEPGLLSSLVRDHVCDDDLPLECIQIDGLDFQLARNSQPHRPIECFKQWTVAQRRAFDDLQWQIKAPVLKNWPLRLPVRELPNRTVLPLKVYIREYEGNSEVARVRIHPEHHKFSGGTEGPSETRSSWYALKTLKAEDEVAFKLEVKALMKIKANPHLVKAAAAFKYQNKYHLLFAWADGGNLLKFWKKQPPDLSHKSVCWLAQQCHGLAHGLNGIHNAEISVADIDAIQNTALTRSPTFSPSPQSPTSQIVGNDKQVHGRHGDIKPQNILWFKQDQNEYGLGVLKITDFGVTAFHSAQTTRVFAHEILVTRTYSAPERDILDAQVSRPFDIWSLGCLYLEFITWILLGNKFIEDFAARRMKDKGTRQKFREDNFYTINGKSQILVGTREYATVKPSVTHWIKFLGQQKECSLFLYEFLDYIEKKMLVVDESRRDKSGMVHLQLKTMFDRCTQDPHYALSRAQRYEIFGTNEEQNTGLYWRQMKCFWCC